MKTWDKLGRAKEEGGAMIHSARALGSAALNLCAVASGSIDIYWEGGCWAWVRMVLIHPRHFLSCVLQAYILRIVPLTIQLSGRLRRLGDPERGRWRHG